MRPSALIILLVAIAFAASDIEAASSHSKRQATESLSTDAPRTLQDLPPGWEAYTDQFIANLTRCHQIIGLSVSVVLANTSIYAKGVGVQSLETMQPVDADTLFSIGSTTKAFTSTLLAMLIDEGHFAPLGWHTLVTSIDPSWSFLDSFMTDRATIADLLAMKSGLSIQPLMMFANQSREDIINNYQKVEPAWDFRTQVSSDAAHSASLRFAVPGRGTAEQAATSPLSAVAHVSSLIVSALC